MCPRICDLEVAQLIAVGRSPRVKMPKAEDSRPRPSAGSFYLAVEEQITDSTLNHQRNFIVPTAVTSRLAPVIDVRK
jgi:hypothetical protein